MAFKYKKVKSDAFKTMQFNAGILLTDFDLDDGTFEDSDIISATTGGIKASCKATFIDLGDDIDNAPKNTKELKELDKWECILTATALETSVALIKLALGCADIDEDNENKVTPRSEVSQDDFQDIYWVGDRKDGASVIIHLKNALSDGGLELTTTDKGKGTVALSLTGHGTIEDTDLVPMDFYVKNFDEEDEDEGTDEGTSENTTP